MSLETMVAELEKLRLRRQSGADVSGELIKLRDGIKAFTPIQLPPPAEMEKFVAQAAALREGLVLGTMGWQPGSDPSVDRQVEAWGPRLLCDSLLKEVDAFLDDYLRDVHSAENEAKELESRLPHLQEELALANAYQELLGLIV